MSDKKESKQEKKLDNDCSQSYQKKEGDEKSKKVIDFNTDSDFELGGIPSSFVS